MTAVPAVPSARRSRARLPLVPVPGLLGKFVTWYSKRTYGEEMEPALAMGHNRKVLMADFGLERKVAKFDALDPTLKMLAEVRTAARIECSWCLDFGYFMAHHKGIDLTKIEAVPHWQDSDVFDDRERRVLAFADAMTETPPTVTDEQVAELRRDLGDAGVVELTMMVAVENLRSRVNSALGLASQGFSESCRVDGGSAGR